MYKSCVTIFLFFLSNKPLTLVGENCQKYVVNNLLFNLFPTVTPDCTIKQQVENWAWEPNSAQFRGVDPTQPLSRYATYSFCPLSNGLSFSGPIQGRAA